MLYIVLSTYNGARFLSKQLDSILSQTYRNFTLLIRDDGSRDDTIKIIEQYQKKYNHIILYKGKNIGVVPSFFELLSLVPANAEFVAFCDQDDIWLANKLEAAVAKISEFPKNIPALYYCAATLIDPTDRIIGKLDISPRAKDLTNSLIENTAVGCTCVINTALLELVKSHKPNLGLVAMHDWWVNIVATAFGNVFYDSYPYLQYRQHQNNVSTNKSLLFRARKFFDKKHKFKILSQASEFLDAFGEILSVEQRKLVLNFIKNAQGGFFTRSYYAYITPLKARTRFRNFVFKVLLISGKL